MKRKTRKNKRQVTRKKRSRGGTIRGSVKAASDTKEKGVVRREAAIKAAIKAARETAIKAARATIRFEDDKTLTVLSPFSGAGIVFSSSASGKAYKIVIVSPNNFEKLDALNIEWEGKLVNINKVTEPIKSVQDEYNGALWIYHKTLRTGYPACFEVYDYFDRDNVKGKELLKTLLQNTIDSTAKVMLQYILEQLTKKNYPFGLHTSFELRIIGMEKAPEDYVSLRKYRERNMPEIQDQMFFLAALIVNIYMKTNFYSLDNSPDNFMGKQNEWKSFDFGLMFNGTATTFGNMFPPNSSHLAKLYHMQRESFEKSGFFNDHSVLKDGQITLFYRDLNYINTNIGNLCSSDVLEDEKVTILDSFFQFVSLIDFCNMMLVNKGHKCPRINYILQYIYGKIKNGTADGPRKEYIPDSWITKISERKAGGAPIFLNNIMYDEDKERVKGNLLQIIRKVCAMSQS